MTKNEPKVAVVTGAASGIGKATLITLLNQGFKVAAMDVDAAGLDGLSSVIKLNKDLCETYVIDISSRFTFWALAKSNSTSRGPL